MRYEAYRPQRCQGYSERRGQFLRAAVRLVEEAVEQFPHHLVDGAEGPVEEEDAVAAADATGLPFVKAVGRVLQSCQQLARSPHALLAGTLAESLRQRQVQGPSLALEDVEDHPGPPSEFGFDLAQPLFDLRQFHDPSLP